MVGCNRELVYTCSSFSPTYKSIHVTFQGNNPALIPADYGSRSYATADSLPHPRAENIAPVYVQSIDIEDDIDLTLSPCSVTSEELPALDLAVLNGEDEEPK